MGAIPVPTRVQPHCREDLQPPELIDLPRFTARPFNPRSSKSRHPTVRGLLTQAAFSSEFCKQPFRINDQGLHFHSTHERLFACTEWHLADVADIDGRWYADCPSEPDPS